MGFPAAKRPKVPRMVCDLHIFSLGFIARFFQTVNSECVDVEMFVDVHYYRLAVDWKLITCVVTGIVDDKVYAANADDGTAEI